MVEGSIAAPFGGEVPAAISGVGARPALESLFAVKKDQPDRVAVELFAACGLGMKPVADGHQQAGGGGAVVGADEVDVAERVIGFVVRAENDDAGLFAGKRTMKLQSGTGQSACQR